MICWSSWYIFYKIYLRSSFKKYIYFTTMQKMAVEFISIRCWYTFSFINITQWRKIMTTKHKTLIILLANDIQHNLGHGNKVVCEIHLTWCQVCCKSCKSCSVWYHALCWKKKIKFDEMCIRNMSNLEKKIM